MSEPTQERQEVYRFRTSLILRFIWAVLRGRTRSLPADVEASLMAAKPKPRARNEQQVQAEGPFVLVGNHYERPGLKVFWGGMLASHAVAQRRTSQKSLRWLMTSEWYNFRLGPLPVPVWALRWLFRRIAQVYGLVIVPRAAERGVGRAGRLQGFRDCVQPVGLHVAQELERQVDALRARPAHQAGDHVGLDLFLQSADFFQDVGASIYTIGIGWILIL